MMSSPRTLLDLQGPRRSPSQTRPGQAPRFWNDPLLLSIALFSGVVLGYQLMVTLLQPSWGDPVTDWLRGTLAWPEWLVVLFVSWRFTRSHRPEALAWWMLSTALLFYTVARTMWTVEDQLIFPNHVPFPSLPDLFFMLQYPFFFLAVILIPSSGSWGSRVKVFLDGLLLMGAATALSWYFLLAPLYLQSQEGLLGKLVNLYYPTSDLVILFGLTVTLIFHRCQVDRKVMVLLIVAILCLVTADSWVAWLIATSGFIAGSPPDLFWIAFYLLLPLASFVGLRLTTPARALPMERLTQPAHTFLRAPMMGASSKTCPRRQDVKEAVQFLFPFVAALLASVVISLRAILAPLPFVHPLIPTLVILGLLALVIVRQGITLLENAQLRYEREAAHASELAVRETNRQLETFLGMVSHELKTPLTSIIMGLQLIQRRERRQMRPGANTSDKANDTSGGVQATLELVGHQAERLNRLVNDLLDLSRIQTGRLKITPQSTDLAAIVGMVVAEQRRLAPERDIRLYLPEGKCVPLWSDAERIGQVVTNYLNNALKYSPEDAVVEVGVQAEDQQGRVWVRDEGPGIPPNQQAQIWERFHQAPGIEVQSGSGVGLGLGLYISKTIIEQHHGRVGVESAPDQGATFWFTLPLPVALSSSNSKA